MRVRRYNRSCLYLISLLLTCNVHASIIESTIGSAVVNDATGTYYNPATLILLSKPQLVTLASAAHFNTKFNGQYSQNILGFNLYGESKSVTHYFLPSSYFAIPITKELTWGFGWINNNFHKDLEADQLLRYAQAENRIQNRDFIVAFGYKINRIFSLGVGFNRSDLEIRLKPIIGFPTLHIEDVQAYNEADNTSWGWHGGFLLKIAKATLIGFNYRSDIIYNLKGTSTLDGITKIYSPNYHLKFWTPKRAVLSVNHQFNKKFGLMSTVQYIKWNTFKKISIHNLATLVRQKRTILGATEVPYHLRNTWLLVLGAHYHPKNNCVLRLASSYVQAASNPRYQLSLGDSLLISFSGGYDFSKMISLDFGYGHAFIRNQSIDIASSRASIKGVNQGRRDAVSMKVTLNFI